MTLRPLLLLAASVAALVACSDKSAPQTAQAPPPPPPPTVEPKPAPVPAPAAAPTPTTAVAPAPSAASPPAPNATPQVAQINDAKFSAPADPAAATPAADKGSKTKPAPDPMLVKAQVLLARADFSPGEVDGLRGSNFRNAVAAYAKANGLQSDGELTQEVWDHLNTAAASPAAGTYTLTEADVSGPWSPETHDSLTEDKGLPAIGFTHASEALGEKFHMSEALLKTLNPGVDFTQAGAPVTVVEVGALSIPKVDHVEVDKAHAAVRAYSADDKVLAVFPATVGSTDRPSPKGVHKVTVVQPNPYYTYDPKKLTWGPKKLGRFTIKPGPNNPVGDIWIGLNAPGYGLHGTPEPRQIGKTASHGCVRMTNWDATLLASGLKPGVKVAFINNRA